jgi:hypothetical protein
MTGARIATAFQTMVARYERCGWVVRTVDYTTLRATVRTNGDAPSSTLDDPPVRIPGRVPACRKLWVDSRGDVQETDVPC